MKTTVKIDMTTSVVIEPNGPGVNLTICVGAIPLRKVTLTPDQVGALAFGLEMAAEHSGIVRDRAQFL